MVFPIRVKSQPIVLSVKGIHNIVQVLSEPLGGMPSRRHQMCGSIRISVMKPDVYD